MDLQQSAEETFASFSLLCFYMCFTALEIQKPAEFKNLREKLKKSKKTKNQSSTMQLCNYAKISKIQLFKVTYN